MKTKSKSLVSIVMGSKSDYGTMRFCEQVLKKLEINFDTKIISAHRTPKRLYEFALNAEKKKNFYNNSWGGRICSPTWNDCCNN